MAKKKLSLQYSQISSDYLSSSAMRRLVRTMRRYDVEKERIPHMKLIIVAVWLYASRTDGFYASADEDFYDAIAEDTDIDDEEIKADIAWLAEHGYFHAEFFHRNIITSVDIQEAYFATARRLKREMPDTEDLAYTLIDNIDSLYSKVPSDGNPKPISTEGKPISSERSPISTEGNRIPTEGKPISAEGSPIPAEGNRISAEGNFIPTEGSPIPTAGLPCSSKYQYKYKENGFIEVLRSYCSSSPGPYNDNENYIFYILFFLLDVKNPAKEVENFVAYNETNGWATKKGVEYDTPRKRFSLALRYSQKEFTRIGRLQISGIKDITFKNRILAFLFELYQFYRNNLNFKHHLIMNPNTNCQFIPIDGVKFKIKLFVGLHTEEFLISDYDNVLDIGRAVIGSALQEIEFARAGKELLAIEPKEINN